MSMIKNALLAAGLSLALTACAGREPPPEGPTGEPMQRLSVVTDNGQHDFWVEIADTEAERAQGLMFRPPLGDDRGMLFQFDDSAERSFWMRNTPSPLDIVYIDGAGRIVSIARHTTPNSDTGIPSNGAATGVLEVRAGRMEEIGAEAGDEVRHPFFEN
ncbi:DUF192 domain-containing protein [Brevundimonas lutea]|uniref:DUF192 domain-containing protein n=1 Tax=Brevundimonas lutea TaxID=2293980 RepID=UPI000F0306D9|nr:DUF192 domain-containing protein [Brevundimonas lutea]